MIIIKAITGEYCEPERILTDKEKITITSQVSNGTEFIYYQGDEPIIEEPYFVSRVAKAVTEPLIEKIVVIDNVEYKLVEKKPSWWKRLFRLIT